MSIMINGIQISYDYNELIDEFLSDIEERYITDTVYIERKESDLYSPIVDWYYSMDQVPFGTKVELAHPEDVIAEMRQLNKII